MSTGGPRDGSAPDEFLRGPRWRTRTTPGRRHRAAAVTFAVILAVGIVLLLAIVTLTAWLGAPAWVTALPWLVPTVAVLAWAVVRPGPAELTDDDDDGWIGFSVRWALVGETELRPLPHRIVAAVLFGAPVAWALLAIGALTLTGIL